MRLITSALLPLLLLTAVHAQTLISQALLDIQTLEQSGDLEAALKTTETALTTYKASTDLLLLQSTKARIQRERDTTLELDAAMKALAANRTDTLEEARASLRNASQAGRTYLRRQVKSGLERDVELAGEALLDLDDSYAADLFVERLKASPDWSVFLVPFLSSIDARLNAQHLEVLIGQAERETLANTQTVALVLATLENLADAASLRDKPAKKRTDGKVTDLSGLAFQLTPDLQNKVSQMLVRYVETQLAGAHQERVRDILVGSHLPVACSLLMDKLNVAELPAEQAKVYFDLLGKMAPHFDPLLIKKLTDLVQAQPAQQADAAHLLLDVLLQLSSPSLQKPRAKISPDVATLSTRLDDPLQQAVVRACLSTIEHQAPANAELVKRTSDFLILSRLPSMPPLFISEMGKDTNRPITDEFIQLAAQMGSRFSTVDANNQNSLIQLMLRWAESRAKPDANDATKAALENGITFMVDSQLPNAPASLTGKLMAAPPGPLADWLVAILEKQTRSFELGILNELIKHMTAKGPELLPAANLLMQHLEQLAWEPDPSPPRLQPNSSRLEKLSTRLNAGYHGNLCQALVATSATYAGKKDASDEEKATLGRADLMITDSRLPPMATYLVDHFNADPKKPEAHHLLLLLNKISDRMSELDDGRKVNLVNGLIGYVRAHAPAAETPETKALAAQASKLLDNPTLVLRSEQLASKLHEIPEPQALNWAIKGIKTGQGLSSQTTMRSLADQAAKPGVHQLTIFETLLDALEKSAGVNTPDALNTTLRADAFPSVLNALVMNIEALHKAMAATTDQKVKSPLKRNLDRAEKILVSSGLPGIPELLIVALAKDPKRPEADIGFKQLARMPQRLLELSADQQNKLFEAFCAFTDAKLAVELKAPEKALVDQAGALLSNPRLSAVPQLMAARLAVLKAGPSADWTGLHLQRMKGQLDDAAVKTLCTYLGTGGENAELAQTVLLDHLESLTGTGASEHLPALLPPDVQTAVTGALRAYMERVLIKPEKPQGPEAAELARNQKFLHTSRLPQVINGLFDDFVKDPARPAADNYVALLAREPARLGELSESQQSALTTALVTYLDTRNDPKRAGDTKHAITLLNEPIMRSAMDVVSSELNKDPARASAGALITVLAANKSRLLEPEATIQSRLAETLVKVIELRATAKPNDPQAAVALEAVKLLGESQLHQAADRMIGRLGSSTVPSPELTRLLIEGLKTQGSQLNQKAFLDLSGIASREGPNQAALSQLVVYILTRAPSVASPAPGANP
ncbi:MAG: hypothetical protein ACI9TH_003570 [Kiritimatiellia bacterium]|jgi:hypothetical protein